MSVRLPIIPRSSIGRWRAYGERQSSRAGTETPPANLDDPETVKAGARIYATIGCVNCHGGPPDANWAKWSEGLKPVPADLKVMAKERTASQLFWAIKNGIKFTGMPSFGLAGVSDKDLWSVVAFVKKMPLRIRRRVQGLDDGALARRAGCFRLNAAESQRLGQQSIAENQK